MKLSITANTGGILDQTATLEFTTFSKKDALEKFEKFVDLVGLQDIQPISISNLQINDLAIQPFTTTNIGGWQNYDSINLTGTGAQPTMQL
jgi:hypothetical protein